MKNRILFIITAFTASLAFGDQALPAPVKHLLDTYLSNYGEQAVQIDFTYEVTSDMNPRNDTGSLVLYGKKFNLQLGPKTIASDGETWQTFDTRTNQLFWQDPDSTFQASILYWLDASNWNDDLSFSTLSENEFQVQFPGSVQLITMTFNEQNTNLISLLVVDPQANQSINDITIKLIPSENLFENIFNLPADQAFFFDLRTR